MGGVMARRGVSFVNPNGVTLGRGRVNYDGALEGFMDACRQTQAYKDSVNANNAYEESVYNMEGEQITPGQNIGPGIGFTYVIANKNDLIKTVDSSKAKEAAAEAAQMV